MRWLAGGTLADRMPLQPASPLGAHAGRELGAQQQTSGRTELAIGRQPAPPGDQGAQLRTLGHPSAGPRVYRGAAPAELGGAVDAVATPEEEIDQIYLKPGIAPQVRHRRG